MSTYDLPLKCGDRNEAVRLLHEYLNFLSHNFSFIPEIIPPDDLFSKSLETSIRNFQKNFSLKETGEADRQTWDRIRKYYFKALRFYGYISASRYITEKQPDMMTENELKNALSVISYFAPHIELSHENDKDSGIFSRNIRKFQKYFDICETGEMGDETKTKMISLFRIIMRSIPERYFSGGSVPFRGNILRYGSKGNDVVRFQSYLRIISANIEEIRFCDITGVFDGQTSEAVRAYQKMYGLPQNGIVGPVTWNGIAKLSDFFRQTIAIK